MKVILLLFVSICSFNTIVSCQGYSAMIGEGKWKVINMMKCENDDDYEMRLDVTRKKVNRTHDGFNGDAKLPFTITDEDYAARIDICKHVDGGCKHYQTVEDESFCKLVNKFSQPNFEAVLTNAGLDPPNCPVPEGDIVVRDFLFDYGKLPKKAVYGRFTAKAYLLKEGKELTCIKGTFEFNKNEDHEDD